MLYQLGPIALDTRPFSAESYSQSGGADLAVKPIMNSLPTREFMGEADDKVNLAGQLLPTRIGGLSELEMVKALSKAGTALPVMRGDGRMLGWFAIESYSEQHTELMRDGVGFVVKYSLALVRVPIPGPVAANGVIGMLLSLFEAL